MIEYEIDLTIWRDNQSAMSSKYLSGKLEGEANKEKYAEEKVKREKLETAKNCLDNGMSIEMTAKVTGLSEDEVREIKG